MHDYCGSIQYMAPEILLKTGRTFYTEKVDIWAIGILTYQLLEGAEEIPYRDLNKNTKLERDDAQMFKKVVQLLKKNQNNQPYIDIKKYLENSSEEISK